MKTRDTLRGTQWLFSFQPIEEEADGLIDRIGPTQSSSIDRDLAAFKETLEAALRGSQDKFDALSDAFERLPGILERMKPFPRSDVRVARKYQDCWVKALSAYIEACKWGLSWMMASLILALLNSGETDYAVIASKVGCSREYVESTVKKSERGPGNSRRVDPGLETVVFFRFIQAHKWWKVSRKMYSAITGF